MMNLEEGNNKLGPEMYSWLVDLFPLCRSITGQGVRDSLAYLKKIVPGLVTHAIPSGTRVFDWMVPQEWHIKDAWIETPSGDKIACFKDSNLSVVGYSHPVDREISLSELQSHLYSLPDQPEAIPYVTSYYKSTWGFCLPHSLRENLVDGTYYVYIDSKLFNGEMNFGELFLPGKRDEEILLSTYICHPSMANNELSGPVLAAALGRSLAEREDRVFSYRILFLPETIGAIAYLARNLEHLKKRVVAGLILTCVGDPGDFSYIPSREGDTYIDKVALHILQKELPRFKRYSFLDRGSDERQFCSPGIDLPVCSITRSKYGTYPEYHTSLDDTTFVTPQALEESYEVYSKVLYCLETNRSPKVQILGEPFLSKRNLYPTTSLRGSAAASQPLLDVFVYADGANTVLDIAERLNLRYADVEEIVKTLEAHALVESDYLS